jgi:malonyl-CoA O-methyltransferase
VTRLRVQDALPAPGAARRAFEQAGGHFDAASVVHDEARQRLLERLGFVRLDPSRIVDLGCATGAGAAALAAAYPRARVTAVDASAALLRVARERHGEGAFDWLRADAERLPLADGTAGLVFANMLLPWCRPEVLFAEAARVLEPSGLMLFATLGPDTLEQVRRAWAAVDDTIHVHAFVDMHDIGDLAVRAGLEEPVLAVERLSLSYATVADLVRDLRGCGGINVAAGRRRGLTGPRRWRSFERALAGEARAARFAVTIELILGHAWGSVRKPRAERGAAEYAVPVDRIGRGRG